MFLRCPGVLKQRRHGKKDVGNFITGQIHSSGLIGGIQLFECQTLYINETTMNNNMFGKNIFGIYPGKKWGTPEDEIVIIGSHWDTLETTDGLNDNGSGSAGILEITRAFMARNVIPDNSFIVVAFDVEDPPRVIILDTLLNYDTKSESQFIPENWLKPAPKAVSWVKKNKNQGDFLAIYNREKTDAGLVETLKKQETISSNVEFLTSDHTRFWFPKNILASGFHAILVTDTGPYRGEMAKCYHSACDSLRFGYTASFKNYDYYLESISLIYDAVVEMTTTPTKNTLMNPFNLFNLDESSSMFHQGVLSHLLTPLHPSAASHHHHPEHSNQLKMTNFSIAAIMNNNNSRKEDEEEDSCSGGTSHRGGSLNSSTLVLRIPPLSIGDRSAIKTELEEEVDVEQCSDGEGAEKEPPPPRIPTHSDSNHAHTSANTTTTNITGSKKKKKDEKTKAMKPKCNSPELLSVDCHLETKELWDKFHELGTEMIITKTGRRMFPTVRCSFTNLRPDRKYWVILDIVPCDNKRYRYAYHRSSWLVAGKADPPPPHRFYIHPDSPVTGDQLRKQVVSFEKVKLTNNEMDKNGQVILNSMHRFQPRIYLVIRPEGASGPVTDIELCRYRSYIYPETIFTAVTAYQNQLITKLKIDSNPFAKGFRDSSRLNGL
ncbi:TBX20 [Lepeophtheirus salmonis]|uniref:TBX20 n=1 Tax=Lepeophtheirus salmonis TaxID=72036 RepID=A0A7R8H518_LEPSM|nr:TBX20 [Lepeophtheirus salmonis]CAF2860053.1 TBX20 [Lepeophtheirus salmonis]